MSMIRKLIVSILAVLCFSVASYGWAWSHKLIGYMAQRNCTETTKAQLDRYLDVPLADISLWMDIYRDYDWGGMDWSEAPEYIQLPRQKDKIAAAVCETAGQLTYVQFSGIDRKKDTLKKE